MATNICVFDKSDAIGQLVGSAELACHPVHRWFAYKEGFSPNLLGTILDELQMSEPVRVLDCFGGVGTTLLSAMADGRVREAVAVEYSPLAHFAASVKVSWPSLDPSRLRRLIPRALDYPSTGDVIVPPLASFSNREIFHPSRLAALLRAINHVRSMDGLTDAERNFLVLGVGAVVEDLSGVMKDGRALRILRDRRRRATSLAGHKPTVKASGVVKRSLAGQWTAMVDDLEACRESRETAQQTPVAVFRGDARRLEEIHRADGSPAIAAESVDVACFSPPYLNCIDYTEVHKLELWLLGFVDSQEAFKRTRLGTLRSHPSVRFPEGAVHLPPGSDVAEFVGGASAWITANGSRPEIGPVVQQYFEDMYGVWQQLARVIRPGGIAVCVVANSTFSKRMKSPAGNAEEQWRLPVFTDVLLGHLAKAAGFDEIEIWHARNLRPRNVRSGRARESAVVARKTEAAYVVAQEIPS